MSVSDSDLDGIDINLSDEDDGGMFDIFGMLGWPVLLAIFIVCVLRAYLKGSEFKEHVSCKGLVAVVTGCSGGIGKQVVRELNYRGAKVYMLCRDKTRGEEALKALIQLGCHADRLILHTVDTTSFESIRLFAEQFDKAEKKLDILVNNAGIMLYPKFKLTDDGHEFVWQTNYLGHFLLTQLLLPKLDASEKGGRIVNVSAMAHFYADSLDTDKVDRREAFDSRYSYARSKLAQVLHAVALTKHLRARNSKVIVNACNPGMVYTRIMRYTPMGSNKFLKTMLSPFAWYFLKTPKDGAQTPLYCALSKEIDGKSGKYFSEQDEKPTSELAQNEKLAAELYNYSMDACGLS